MKKLFGLILLTSLSNIVFGQTAHNNPASVLAKRSTRATNSIQQTFPYDIQLVNAKGEISPSTKVLARNGKPTVLAFWLTTCVPCRHELTAISGKFEAWQKEKGFNFFAISIDFPNNYEQFLKRVEDSKWPFPAYYDLNQEFMWVMPGNLNGLPQVFVLDKSGKIVHHTRRYATGDEDRLFEVIKGIK